MQKINAITIYPITITTYLFISCLLLLPVTSFAASSSDLSVKSGTWQLGDHQQPDFSGDYSDENFQASPELWNIYVPYLGQEYTDASAEELINRLRGLEQSPGASLTISGDSTNLTGVVNFTVNIDHAEHVEIKLSTPGTDQYIWLGDSQRSTSKVRTLSWDTKNTPNGSYTVEAFVSNVFGRYELTGPTVTINNASQGLKKPLREHIGIPQKIRTELSEKLPFSPEDPDGDSDGLPDKAEPTFGTDPLNPDSDGDGYLDGIEVARDTDPNSAASPGQNVHLPKSAEETGETNEDLYTIDDISLDTSTGPGAISIEGQARPKSIAVVYVYSTLPTMVTVKTDDQGNFKYTLTRSLDDGEHRVYVGLADANGTLAEKSRPRFFIKEAQAIILSDLPPATTKHKKDVTPQSTTTPTPELTDNQITPSSPAPTLSPTLTETPTSPPTRIVTPKSPLRPLYVVLTVILTIILASALLGLILWYVLRDQKKTDKPKNRTGDSDVKQEPPKTKSPKKE